MTKSLLILASTIALICNMVSCQSMSVTVGGIAWADSNNNGVRSASETGVAAIVVRVLSVEGFVIDSLTTGSDGRFNKTISMPAGQKFQLQFELPEQGWKFSPSFATADVSIASVVFYPITGKTNLFEVVYNVGETITFDQINAGLVPAPCVRCISKYPQTTCDSAACQPDPNASNPHF